MSTLTGSHFYIPKPFGEYWSTLTNYVVEAKPVDTTEIGLHDWEKTDEFVRENLKVVTPENWFLTHLTKKNWVECQGPCRRLEFHEYVELYHAIDPNHPLPIGWKQYTL